MTDYPVSNDGQLSSARSSAGAGDTITLANGTYSGFTWAKNVGASHGLLTIQAANPGQATISSRLTLNNCSGLKFTGVNIPQGFERGFGTNAYLTFEYGNVGGLLRLTSATNCIVQYCEVDGPYIEIDQNSSYITFQENYVHDVSSDTANCTGAAHHIDWINNVIYDMHSSVRVYDPHWDLCIQFFGVSGVKPADFNIRGNIVIDNPATVILRKDINGNPVSDGESQGIFLGGAGGGTYINGVIEQNLVWVQNANGLRFTNTGTGCLVRNNSFISGAILVNQDDGWSYSLPITDNIAPYISDADTQPSGGHPTLSGNVTFSSASDVYDDPGTTNGVLDYRRFISSAYPTKGAATRIAEIQAGTNVYALVLAGMAAVGGATPTAPSIPSNPTISGTEAVNQILTATPSTPVGGYPAPIRTWQWYNSVSGAIAGATSQTYQLQASDEGDTVYVIQTEDNDVEPNATAQSSNTGTIAAAPTAPSVSSFSPADNATGVAVDATLTITFYDTMQLGPSGRVNLWRSDQGIVDFWDVVTHAGTGDHSIHADGNDIILTGWAAWPMHLGITYSILIDDGALESTEGVAFPGIADTATWNFTTVGTDAPAFGGRILTSITVA